MSRIVTICGAGERADKIPEDWMRLPGLIAGVRDMGKPSWAGMLDYVARLHERSIHSFGGGLPYPWEEIGKGYVGGRAFGHWDITHQILDSMPFEPDHARRQLENYFHSQVPGGYMPGTIYFADNPNPDLADRYPCYFNGCGHPPVWPFAVEDYFQLTGDGEFLRRAVRVAEEQTAWFESRRQSPDGGFYYLDMLEDRWESGVDEGIRFQSRPASPMACIDATSHVFLLFDSARRWRERLEMPSASFGQKADDLRGLITESLFCEESGFFFDRWSLCQGNDRPYAFEGMWPMVVGAALPEQAGRVVCENLMNPNRFFTPHPISTVSVSDTERFCLRAWQGPVWNSMTYWAARGCMDCGYPEEAAAMLEAALDGTADVFEQTGTIWEFYHPFGGRPLELERKPQSGFNTPCRDYLGHNPMLAMARLYEQCRASEPTSGLEVLSV